ncbi:MAG TPA: acyl carrier protein [Mucilaginibacter sp.]|nr:acyl carrier protein [Mucilaginibacter sp.]
MDRNEIFKHVNEVFIDVLDDGNIVLSEETTANDVDDWDSLNHIQLVVAIEKLFKIRFSSKEIQSWKNVGEMISCIQGKAA